MTHPNNAKLAAGALLAGASPLSGDKVLGNQIVHYGAPRPADTTPAHILRMIDTYTRRLGRYA